MALDLKEEGNGFLKEGKYDKALESYNKAIQLDGKNSVLYANRSKTLLELERYAESFSDAQTCISLDPKYSKGYYRSGSALVKLGLLDEALLSFRKGIECDPNNVELKKLVQGLEHTMKQRQTVMEKVGKQAHTQDRHPVDQQQKEQKVPKDPEPKDQPKPKTRKQERNRAKKERKKSQQNVEKKSQEMPQTLPQKSMEQTVQMTDVEILCSAKWTKMRATESLEPRGRVVHACAVHEDQLIFWGGVNVSAEDMLMGIPMSMSDVMLSFDTVSKQFYTPHQLGNKPYGRNACSLTSIGDDLYLLGGSLENSPYKFDVKSMTWKKLHFAKELPFLVSHSVATVGHKIYTFGGTKEYLLASKVFGNDLLEINVQTLQWKVLKPTNGESPPPRGVAAMESINDRFLLVFGGDHSGMKCLDDLWLFDLHKGSWHLIKEGTSHPSRRAGTSFAKYTPKDGKSPSHLLLFGGGTISGTMLNDLWALSVADLKWREVKTGSKNMAKLGQHTSAVVGDSLYVYGGQESNYAVRRANGYPQIRLSPFLYTFPVGDVLGNLAQRNDCIWACLGCGGYTTSKCSQCKQARFCNKDCETAGNEKHLKECRKLRGLEDESVVRTRQLENELTKINELIGKQQKEILENQTKNEETEAKLQRTKLQLKEAAQQIQMMQETLKANAEKLTGKEREIENSKERKQMQVKQLQITVETLNSERKAIEGLLMKRTSAIAKLEKDIESLQNDFQSSIERNNTLSNELKEAKSQKDETLSELEKFQLCPVCEENRRDCCLQPCGHLFCQKCISTWNTIGPTCPTCRTKIASTTKIFI